MRQRWRLEVVREDWADPKRTLTAELILHTAGPGRWLAFWRRLPLLAQFAESSRMGHYHLGHQDLLEYEAVL